jgi:ribosomal protein S18 acetylase RimI-like enzyme
VATRTTDWLARIEDAGINASAPREQLWVDGWLVRRSPGKAKRARCIQPVAPGRLGVDDKLSQCLPLYAAAGLQLYVRITPFAQPAGLDRHLAALGMARTDDSLVMTLPSLDAIDTSESAGRRAETESARFETVGAAAFAEWVGAARGSSPAERAAHADRIAHAPVPHTAVVVRDDRGIAVSGGQVAVEGSLAGLYDIFTIDEARCRGHAERVCRHLLETARSLGASAGYLQVEAANDGAQDIYRRLGFRDAYSYHYRTPAAAS